MDLEMLFEMVTTFAGDILANQKFIVTRSYIIISIAYFFLAWQIRILIVFLLLLIA